MHSKQNVRQSFLLYSVSSLINHWNFIRKYFVHSLQKNNNNNNDDVIINVVFVAIVGRNGNLHSNQMHCDFIHCHLAGFVLRLFAILVYLLLHYYYYRHRHYYCRNAREYIFNIIVCVTSRIVYGYVVVFMLACDANFVFDERDNFHSVVSIITYITILWRRRYPTTMKEDSCV